MLCYFIAVKLFWSFYSEISNILDQKLDFDLRIFDLIPKIFFVKEMFQDFKYEIMDDFVNLCQCKCCEDWNVAIMEHLVKFRSTTFLILIPKMLKKLIIIIIII